MQKKGSCERIINSECLCINCIIQIAVLRFGAWDCWAIPSKMGLALDEFWKKWYNISRRRYGNESCSWVHHRRLRFSDHFFQVQSRVADFRLVRQVWIRSLQIWIIIRCTDKQCESLFCTFELPYTLISRPHNNRFICSYSAFMGNYCNQLLCAYVLP